MKTKFCTVVMGLLALNVLADPQITSWFIVDSGQFAQIYRTDAEKFSGRSETTWSNGRQSQLHPAFCGVQEILSSTNWIYVRSTGLGSQIMGPWYLDAQRRFLFPNLPVDQHFIFAIPRHPSAQTLQRFNHLGEIGLFVDGVRMFDANDAFVMEGKTFDPALGHQQQWGTYHYHAEPLGLRYLLGDHVDFDPATKAYHESGDVPVKHSPILGWLDDGYPVYGPYGYSDPTNPASGVRRMVSGFVLRDGTQGTDNLALTGRRTLPAWDARELNRSATLQDFETGPAVSERYPPGRYLEDYAYLGDLGKVLGRDFDLDELNGRWCVTPEFPRGTYAYFTTIDANGRPVYPYNMGRRFHGNPYGRLVRFIGEPVTTNFVAQVVATAEAVPARTTTLTWNRASGSYESK
jgi:hypothetical protein